MEAAEPGLLDEATAAGTGLGVSGTAWVSISASRSTRSGARRRISKQT